MQTCDCTLCLHRRRVKEREITIIARAVDGSESDRRRLELCKFNARSYRLNLHIQSQVYNEYSLQSISNGILLVKLGKLWTSIVFAIVTCLAQKALTARLTACIAETNDSSFKFGLPWKKMMRAPLVLLLKLIKH